MSDAIFNKEKHAFKKCLPYLADILPYDEICKVNPTQCHQIFYGYNFILVKNTKRDPFFTAYVLELNVCFSTLLETLQIIDRYEYVFSTEEGLLDNICRKALNSLIEGTYAYRDVMSRESLHLFIKNNPEDTFNFIVAFLSVFGTSIFKTIPLQTKPAVPNLNKVTSNFMYFRLMHDNIRKINTINYILQQNGYKQCNFNKSEDAFTVNEPKIYRQLDCIEFNVVDCFNIEKILTLTTEIDVKKKQQGKRRDLEKTTTA